MECSGLWVEKLEKLLKLLKVLSLWGFGESG